MDDGTVYYLTRYTLHCIPGPYCFFFFTGRAHTVNSENILDYMDRYPAMSELQRFFLGREIAKKRDNLQMYKCDPLYYIASKLQVRSNAPKFSDDIASLWMNVPTLDE
jgi:hypothetical protein